MSQIRFCKGPGEVAFDNELSSKLDDEEDPGTGSKDSGSLVDGDVEGAIEDGQPLLQDWAMLWEVSSPCWRIWVAPVTASQGRVKTSQRYSQSEGEGYHLRLGSKCDWEMEIKRDGYDA
ncbi:hypothetical protein PN498_18160 [Oscillatoria sp. CS-180]|uniref:hypothetical protein n=1 Tax=Oscillatoria sp. CS-180 TaxID=3021720 RepID=UPI002331503C|nr:hypothetical protein [Oscillatoria sp. CS-180]MDB9527923.1 hypothetical protein [Oscillatoria sp. CS-180]